MKITDRDAESGKKREREREGERDRRKHFQFDLWHVNLWKFTAAQACFYVNRTEFS